jgi:hypothetical protein
MRQLLLTVSFYFIFFFIQAQTGKDIVAGLRSINKTVFTKLCVSDSAAAISNRAMNIFMADKTGYLSAPTDLSFYTNYATVNTAEGKFTVNHNFQKASGADEPIKKLLSIGFDMTVASSFSKSFLDKRYENELGVTANYIWLGKVKTRFANCAGPQNNTNQKQAMDALRSAMLAQLETEINKKETDFKQALNAIDAATVPGQNIDTAKVLMQQNFYADLKDAYEEKFATLQAALLTKTGNFKLIRTNWTSFSAYIPLLFPEYTVAPSFVTSFNKKQSYPVNIMLNHTRMWESSKTGRLFFTLAGNMLFNNSKLSYGLSKLNYSEYKSLGGTDPQHSTDPGNNKLYIGEYKTFITPSLTARLAYFPPDSHVGLSLLAEQNFGQYNLLNARIAIPIILINSKKTPAVNIECYVLLLDLTNKMSTIDNTSIGLSVGVPFSRLMF